MSSIVYFAECDGLIKIGFTKHLKKRVAQMSTGNPRSMTIIATVRGGRSLEKKIHGELAQFREHGEWFLDCAEVRAALDAFQSESAKANDISKALQEIAKSAPSPEPAQTLQQLSERFTRLMELRILDDLSAAFQMEKARNLRRGSLMDGVIGDASRRRQFDVAMGMLLDSWREYAKLLDQAALETEPYDYAALVGRISSILFPIEAVFHRFIEDYEVYLRRTNRKVQ